MPGLNGLEATARALKTHPEIKIIILSMHNNEEYVLQSLKAGASGYLLKDAGPSELELALKAVASGKTFLSPAVSKHLIDAYVKGLTVHPNLFPCSPAGKGRFFSSLPKAAPRDRSPIS